MSRLYLPAVPFVHNISRYGYPVVQSPAVQYDDILRTVVSHASEARLDYVGRIVFTLKPDAEYPVGLRSLRGKSLAVRLYGYHIRDIAVEIPVHGLADDFAPSAAASVVLFPEAVEDVPLEEYFSPCYALSADTCAYLYTEKPDEFRSGIAFSVDGEYVLEDR